MIYALIKQNSYIECRIVPRGKFLKMHEILASGTNILNIKLILFLPYIHIHVLIDISGGSIEIIFKGDFNLYIFF